MNHPYKQFRPAQQIHVKVITTDMETNDVRMMIINYSDEYQRKWLARHSWWCFTNNKMVSTCATEEAVTFVDKREKEE